MPRVTHVSISHHPEPASGLWRSEDMLKVDMIVQRDAVPTVLQCIARTKCAQPVDLVRDQLSAFQRPHATDVRRCEDMERRLRFFLEHMRTAGIDPVEPVVIDDEEGVEEAAPDLVTTAALDKLERTLEQLDGDLRQQNGALETMHFEYMRLRQEYEVLVRDATDGYAAAIDQARVATQVAGLPTLLLAGTISSRAVDRLRLMVNRMSRGNAYVRTEDILEDFRSPVATAFNTSADASEPLLKSVFYIFVPTDSLRRRLRKTVESMGGSVVDADGVAAEIHGGNAAATHRRTQSIRTTFDVTRSSRNETLRKIASSFYEWRRMVVTFKTVFATMNLLDLNGATAKGRFWIPTAELQTFGRAIEKGCERSGEMIAPIVSPCGAEEQTGQPTFFRTNKVTSSFQGIVDSYGVARYKEVNPGVFTIITFPYLFGIMYGDMGHGVLLTLFAFLLVAFERPLQRGRLNEIFAMIFGGRYLLVAMGLFATYVGILYNDCFGMSVELFSSGYKWPALPPHGPNGVVTPLHPNGRPSVKPSTSVAFGIDSAWGETENKLEFYNSTKMKCAIIIGVLQMMGGIVLSLLNHIHRKDWRHILFAFLPEAVFLMATFGYMSILIVVKWLTPWPNTNHAPSLLETMTGFFLQPGFVAAELYSGQAQVQTGLLLLAVSMVPLMVAVIPYLDYKDHSTPTARKQPRRRGSDTGEDFELQRLELGEAGTDGVDMMAPSVLEEKPYDFSEVMIHYVIHTIEFVLGCVSNTASYLRLWALSLAHAQLSEVFLNFALMAAVGMDSGNGIVLFLGVGVWLGATIGVLLGMESLSAFLHALRLHWVEFQSKFYAGDGKAFLPLTLEEATRLL